jgi:hypothetical protein
VGSFFGSLQRAFSKNVVEGQKLEFRLFSLFNWVLIEEQKVEDLGLFCPCFKSMVFHSLQRGNSWLKGTSF